MSNILYNQKKYATIRSLRFFAIGGSFYTTANDTEDKMSADENVNFEDGVIIQMELLHEAEGICISYFKENIKKKQSIREFFERISRKTDNNIFCIGVGRSGLAVRTFAMRLTQMEYRRVYVSGETTTPAVKKDDIVVVISSSGETETVRNLVMKYKAYGAIVVALSAHKESTIGNVADLFIHIPDKNQILIDNPGFAAKVKDLKNWAPLGTVSEDFAIKFLDAFVTELMTVTGKTEKDLKFVHQIE